MDTVPYIYSEEWKSVVSKSSPEWRSYCEALSRVKRFFRLQLTSGRTLAVADFKQYVSLLEGDGEAQPRRVREAIDKLQSDFNLIGIHEGDRIRDEILQELQKQAELATS
jgi:hypothetical protein